MFEAIREVIVQGRVGHGAWINLGYWEVSLRMVELDDLKSPLQPKPFPVVCICFSKCSAISNCFHGVKARCSLALQA